LLEGFFSADEIPLLSLHHLSAVIHAPWQIDALLQANTANLKVWLKINSGMNRLGIQPDELPAALLRLAQIKANVTLMTHFARADEVDGIAEQFQLFNTLTHGMQLPRSLSNSAALLNYPETHSNWVRPGIMLYGASPTSHQSAPSLGLQPAMTLRSEIIAVHEIQAGNAVGYGASFRAEHAMRIGTVACGYADGYPRHAPTGTPSLVDGVRSRIIGRVSMDMLTVDLSAIPQAQLGSSVTLWGEGLPVDEVATSAGTISYELLCALAPRVPIVEAG
jgi:alanine racemase